jgi:uncharacterized integral membrane protein
MNLASLGQYDIRVSFLATNEIDKQDGQCTAKVPLKRVRATVVAMEKQYAFIIIIIIIIVIIVCPYSWLSYPACKSHGPYYIVIVVCGLSGCAIFVTLSHKRHDFLEKKKKIEH